MNIFTGQGLYLKMPFADGAPCSVKRTFLVIHADSATNKVTVLNVSSIKGKVHKTSFPSNKVINKFKPPFMMPSFVKLDAIYEINYFARLENAVLANRQVIDVDELNDIMTGFASYRHSNPNDIRTVFYDQTHVLV